MNALEVHDNVRNTIDSMCCLHYVGTPDGWNAVAMSHRSIANLALSMAADLGIGAEDTTLALRSNFFTSSAFELWMPLCAGAKIVLAPGGMARDGVSLSTLVSHERVSFLHASAPCWGELIETGLRATRGLVGLCGGSLPDELAEHILERCRVLFAGYGCAETTLYATVGRVERTLPVTVGTPISNAHLHVLDARGEPVAVGVVGNLLVGGDVISKYRDPSRVTNTAFVPDPCGEGVAFVTGQRARWRSGGRLELVSAERVSTATANLLNR